MSLVKFSDIHRFLHDQGVFSDIFDVIRVVDPLSGKVFEYEDRILARTGEACMDLLGNEERCMNCSSARAFHSNEQVMKFEYAGDEVFVVISVPMKYEGQQLVVELIRNITRSTKGDLEESAHNEELMSFINNLNASASIDALTGLKNRPFIDSHFTDILQKYVSNGTTLSIAMIGFDCWSLSGVYGNTCAELILSSVGGIIPTFIRSESDIAARFEDEKILICFPSLSAEECLDVCGRIRDRIEETVVNYRGQPVHETVSVGIASNSDTTDAEALIDLSLKRLGDAKKKGKSSICYQ